jgi:uncharacterized protein (TIGR02678 family)
MTSDTAATPTAEAGLPQRTRNAWTPEADSEAAAALRLLAVRPWLVAGRDDKAISAVRRNLPAICDVIARLGWVLIVERDFVRLRKSPPVRRDAWAASGPSPLVCSWFFLLVAAAESMPPRVAIGQLVTAARHASAEASLSAPGDIHERRAIVAALRMLDERGVVERMDGDIDGFIHDDNAPVLLAVHHTRLVHVITNYGSADPAVDPEGWLEQAERERDTARRMRRRLIDDTVVHTRDLDDAEADWLSRRVRGDDGAPLAAAFGLHLERRAEGAAFIVPDDAFRYPHELGPVPFPTPGTIPHAALLLTDYAGAVGCGTDGPGPGWLGLSPDAVARRLTDLAVIHGGWASEYANHVEHLVAEVYALLSGLGLVRRDSNGLWWFSPVAGRWRAPPDEPNERPARQSAEATRAVTPDPETLWPDGRMGGGE